MGAQLGAAVRWLMLGAVPPWPELSTSICTPPIRECTGTRPPPGLRLIYLGGPLSPSMPQPFPPVPVILQPLPLPPPAPPAHSSLLLPGTLPSRPHSGLMPRFHPRLPHPLHLVLQGELRSQTHMLSPNLSTPSTWLFFFSEIGSFQM